MAWQDSINILIGAGIGGLISFISTRSQFERDRRWQRDRLLQEKLLEIAELSETVQQKISEACANTIAAMGRGETPKVLDFIPLERLKILIGFYAPELRPHTEQMVKVWNEIGNSFAAVLSTRTLGASQQQELNLKLLHGIRDIREACKHLTEAAAQLAQRRLGTSMDHRR